MEAICIMCRGTFDYEPIEGLPFELKPTVCEACDEKRRATEATRLEKERFSDWVRLCPKIYQDTDPNHPSMPTAKKLSRILNWQVGPRGLIVIGLTRTCKTRSVWLLIKRLVLEGVCVEAMTSGEFALQCAESHTNGADAAREWFDRLSDADVLFIDDLGKFKLTERVESDLFELIERRTSNARPTIFTSNFTGDVLAQKMTPDRGPAIVSRIREFCESVSL